MTPSIGSIVADRFELVRELGRGTMGSVWLANHLTLRVRCAVKFMSSDSQVQGDPSFRARFEFEARAIAQLQSPHVVRILDYAAVDECGRKINPKIKIVYCSGFPANALAERSTPLVDGPLLRKPYQRSEFNDLVHRVMRNGGAEIADTSPMEMQDRDPEPAKT